MLEYWVGGEGPKRAGGRDRTDRVGSDEASNRMPLAQQRMKPELRNRSVSRLPAPIRTKALYLRRFTRAHLFANEEEVLESSSASNRSLHPF